MIIDNSIFNKIKNKYTIDQVMIHHENSIGIFIPPELIINEYNGYSFCARKDSGADISTKSSKFHKYIKLITGLTAQELFDVLILNINDTDDRPKCKYCGKYLQWSGRFTFGYGNSQRIWNFENHFCNHSCRAKYSVSNNLTGFGTYLNQARAQRSQFLTYGNELDICYFYIAIDGSELKFGICTDPDRRFLIQKFNKYKLIFSGTRIQVANLEYWIKIELKDHKELIPYNRELHKFRRAYVNSLKLINQNP